MLQGDVQPLIQQAIASGAKCTMPDGRELTFPEFVKELSGKNGIEAMAACGYDAKEVVAKLNS